MKKLFEQKQIDGPAGMIELRCSLISEDMETPEALVILSHPHPLHGGTMNNKVVTTMERAFQSLGYVTVAYNFRGVGQSDGVYDHGEGEQADLLAVIKWAQQHFNVNHLILAGFSFGSYVSLKVVQSAQVEVQALCTVAPPIGLYDFSGIFLRKDRQDIAWTLIQGGQDEVVSAQAVLDWAMNQKNKPDLYWREGAGHFFHGELIWLKKVILLAF